MIFSRPCERRESAFFSGTLLEQAISTYRVGLHDEILHRYNEGMKDYYAILQIDLNASPAMITQAYREMVSRSHPQVFHTRRKAPMEARMRELNEAYEVLADPIARTRYDSKLQAYRLSVRDFSPQTPSSPLRRWLRILFWFALFSLGLTLVRQLSPGFFLKDLLLSGLAFALFFCVLREYFPRRAG